MTPIIQEDITGCAIASVAAIKGITYKESKKIAESIGINVENSVLWSDTKPICKLLGHLGCNTGEAINFTNWNILPDLSILATKWHLENGVPH